MNDDTPTYKIDLPPKLPGETLMDWVIRNKLTLCAPNPGVKLNISPTKEPTDVRLKYEPYSQTCTFYNQTWTFYKLRTIKGSVDIR